MRLTIELKGSEMATRYGVPHTVEVVAEVSSHEQAHKILDKVLDQAEFD